MKERPSRFRDRDAKIPLEEATDFAGRMTKVALLKLYEKPMFRARAAQAWLRGEKSVIFKDNGKEVKVTREVEKKSESSLKIGITDAEGIIEEVQFVIDATWDQYKRRGKMPRVKHLRFINNQIVSRVNTRMALIEAEAFINRL